MKKPKCNQCKKQDKVVLIQYEQSIDSNKSGIVWEGYECERCNCVVKELFNA